VPGTKSAKSCQVVPGTRSCQVPDRARYHPCLRGDRRARANTFDDEDFGGAASSAAAPTPAAFDAVGSSFGEADRLASASSGGFLRVS
jgi:hypothetical protein